MKNRAFTLIELLVAIAIIGILSSVIFAAVGSQREAARIAAGKKFDANAMHGVGDTLAGAWEFDECSGTAALDRSGNNATGAVTGGVAWSTDSPYQGGCSLDFNGSTGFVNVTNQPSLNAASSFTITAWIKPTAYPTASNFNENIVAHQDWGAKLGYRMYLGSPGIGKLGAGVGNGTTQFEGGVPWVPPLNLWSHVAVVYANTKLSFYANGAYVGSFVTTNVPFVQNDPHNATIGRHSSAGEYFSGQIDQVRFYQNAMTASAVRDLYEGGRSIHSIATNL